MPYLTEDESTPDWSENFSSLKLIKMVVPSVSNITELNLSSSTTAMMVERWGRPSNTPVDMSKVAEMPMTMHDDPYEDISAEVTEETMGNTSKMWTALTLTKPNRTMATTELTRNRKSTRGPEQDLLLDKTSIKSWHKTNTALALNEVQTETDEPNKDKEAEPDDNTPEANERALAVAIREVDRHSNDLLTIMSGFKKPPNQPHIIDVEDEDNPEEETDEITTMGKFKIPPARPHIIIMESDNSEDETDEPAQTADIPEEWVEQDDAPPTTPRTTTEEAAPIPPHEGLHRSRYLVKACGYFTHGIWCDCPFIPEPSPRYHMETNLNVPQTLPTKPRKSDKSRQEEWDKTYGVPAVKVSKLGFPVDGTAYSARQIQAMMRKTLEGGMDETNTIKEVDHHQTSPGPETGPRDQAGLHERQAHRPGRQTVLQDHQQYRDGDPHHAGTGPGAVADRAGLRDQRQDGDPHHAAPVEDDQRVQPRPEPRTR
jgi:hypothetical protein